MTNEGYPKSIFIETVLTDLRVWRALLCAVQLSRYPCPGVRPVGFFTKIRVRRFGVKISTKGRYAVMAVVDLTSMSAGQPVPLADIAERQDISLSYLEQLFAKLKKGGIVKSVRGPGGGYTLAAPASSIQISTIIKSVDESTRPVRCSPSSPHQCIPGNQRCATHALWEMLKVHMDAALSSVTLADVCEGHIPIPEQQAPSVVEHGG